MPPRRFSRYTFSVGIEDPEGDLILTDPEPFRFRNLEDNRVHVVGGGETLWELADRYFQPMPRAAGLWWIIADFQPDPIHDPTVKLTPGRRLIIPSIRTVQEEIFNERRRRI